MVFIALFTFAFPFPMLVTINKYYDLLTDMYVCMYASMILLHTHTRTHDEMQCNKYNAMQCNDMKM